MSADLAKLPSKGKLLLESFDFPRHCRIKAGLARRTQPISMIYFILLQNRTGKTRLSKWYAPYEDDEKEQIKAQVHRLIVGRDHKFTNFVEFQKHKIIYRRYAGLYFSFCVDVNDNELSILEAIHLFVEILDHFFGNVCELDLVFSFHKAYMVLDELFLAGEISETSRQSILARLASLQESS